MLILACACGSQSHSTLFVCLLLYFCCSNIVKKAITPDAAAKCCDGTLDQWLESNIRSTFLDLEVNNSKPIVLWNLIDMNEVQVKY